MPIYMRYTIILAGLTLITSLVLLTQQHGSFTNTLPLSRLYGPAAGVQPVWQGWPEQLSPAAPGYRRRASWGALKRQGAGLVLNENLRRDRKYFITFPGLGWNNQVIDMMNSYLSNRIPILTPFWPHGHHYDHNFGADAPVGDIFDLPHLRAILGDKPIVEVHELKPSRAVPERWRRIMYDGELPQNSSTGEPLQVGDWIEPLSLQVQVEVLEGADSAVVDSMATLDGGEEEDLHCWSSWQPIGYREPNYSERVDVYLDCTPLPPSLYEGGLGSFEIDLPGTAAHLRKAWPVIPAESLNVTAQYGFPEPLERPYDHLACMDSCYWFMENPKKPDLLDEWRRGRGTWAAVGKHMRWRKEVEELGVSVGRRLLGVRDGGELPPYIGIHIRRGDFSQEWMDIGARHYGFIAHQLLSTIYNNAGVRIQHVMVMTEEEDEQWLAPLREWGFVIAKHGDLGLYDPEDTWLAVVIDSILLSKGKGFLGVAPSTMSILSYLRCQDWNQGIGRFMPHPPTIKVPEDWDWSWDPAPL